MHKALVWCDNIDTCTDILHIKRLNVTRGLVFKIDVCLQTMDRFPQYSGFCDLNVAANEDFTQMCYKLIECKWYSDYL